MKKALSLAALLVSFGMLHAQSWTPAGSFMHYDGKIGMGTGTDDPRFKLRVRGHGAGEFGDESDNTIYGAGVQITRPADQGDEKFHLAFVRAGNTIAGMGYKRNSNIFGIWATPPQGTYSVATIALMTNGNVGIGTENPGVYKLAVEGTLGARRVRVTSSPVWADYVFESNYALTPLKELEAFIKKNKHLPEVPTTAEVAKDGVDVGDTQGLLLKKIEELTLYVIEQNKKIEAQQEKIQALESKVK